MTPRKFIVVSGYHATREDRWQPWFHDLWWNHNILPLLFQGCEKVFIIANQPGYCPEEFRHGTWINLPGDLGYSDVIFKANKPIMLPQCPASWLAGAWLAYGAECDMVYIEQDCLCFGPWLEKMYQDCGDKGMVFGNAKMFGASTSLFLLRHEMIPSWTTSYLMEGREDIPERLPERKMFRLRERKPEHYATLSFGYDRDRPINLDDEVFYAQKLYPDEMLKLREVGRLKFDLLPPVPLFSNHV